MALRRRTEVRIDTGILKDNAKKIRSLLQPSVQFMAVLKGDAYGHGLEGVLPVMEEAGVDQYAVATVDEGEKLRANGIEKPILILDDINEYDADQIAALDLMPTVYSLEMAKMLDEAAKKNHTVVGIHIKIDTGLHRIGMLPSEQTLDVIEQIAHMENIKIEGIFSHFARADEKDSPATTRQLQQFLEITTALEKQGIDVGLRHIMNSPALLLHPEAQLDMVRVGDVLFGLCPTDQIDWEKTGFRQALSWYTRIAMVKELGPGEEIGYEGGYLVCRPMKIATLPVGFADGYRWNLSNLGYVMIRGKKAPIVGRVCMDQCMVDVTDIEGAERGDTVTLLGEGISVATMAELLKTNIDEVACDINQRVPKIYI